MKNHFRKLGSNALGFTKLGVLQGVGISAIGKAGGDTSALSGMSSYNPIMGNIAGASATLGMMGELAPRKRKKRRGY